MHGRAGKVTMTKEFETRIQKERIVDTKNYRYVYECDFDKAVIKRLPIRELDTTAALTDWKIVKIYR